MPLDWESNCRNKDKTMTYSIFLIIRTLTICKWSCLSLKAQHYYTIIKDMTHRIYSWLLWHLRFHYHHSLMIDRWKVDFNWYIKYYSYIVQNKVVIELETEYPLKTNIKRLQYYMFFYLGQWNVSRITWSLGCSQNLCVTKYDLNFCSSCRYFPKI